MSLADLIAAAEQGIIVMPPAELQRLKNAAAEPVRHSASAASAGGVRGSRSGNGSANGAGSRCPVEPVREHFEVTVQHAKSTGVPYLGVRLHLALNGRPLRPAYVSALGARYIIDHADELRAALDKADAQLSA
jgi:hypothetical protein